MTRALHRQVSSTEVPAPDATPVARASRRCGQVRLVARQVQCT